MATWSEKKAKEKKKKDYEDYPSEGRKVSRAKVTEPDEVSDTTAHEVKREADLKKHKGGRY